MSRLTRIDIELVTQGGDVRPPPDGSPSATDREASEVPVPATKSRSLALTPDVSLDRLIDEVFRECLRHVLANRLPALADDEPEGLHQLRVAIRRTRSALRLFDDVVDPSCARALARELRWVGVRLSAARDWDVFVDETLSPLIQALPDHKGLRRLDRRARKRRVAVRDRVRRAIESTRFAQLSGALEAGLGAGGWRPAVGTKRAARLSESARGVTGPWLEFRLARVQSLADRMDALAAKDLHRLRLRVKHLRYAAECLAPLHAEQWAGRPLRRLARVQDALGRIQDAGVAEQFAREIEQSTKKKKRRKVAHGVDVVVGWSRRGAAIGRSESNEAWKRFAETQLLQPG